MKIAVITTSRRTYAYPENTIPAKCSEILTDNPLIRKYAEDNHVKCSEVSLSDAVENADYVIILCNKKASKLDSIIGKCNRFKKSFEVVIIE